MTWEDCVNSDYNILDLDTSYGTVGIGMLHSVYYNNNVAVSLDDLIDGSIVYFIEGM